MTRLNSVIETPTERRKRYPFAGLEPHTSGLLDRRTTIIPEGCLTLRFTDVTGRTSSGRPSVSDLFPSLCPFFADLPFPGRPLWVAPKMK